MSRFAVLMSTVIVTGVSALAFAPSYTQSTGQPPEAQPTPEEMMQQWFALNQPGEHHEHLRKLVGTWDAQVKTYMTPGAEPTVSKGVQTNHMMLDGHYLVSEYEGTFMDKPFKGHGILGYDNVKKQYVNFWIDSLSTGFMTSTGQCSEEAQRLECSGTMEFPDMPGPCSMRQVWKWVDPDTYTYESYDTMPGSPETLSMSITYTRQRRGAGETGRPGTAPAR